MPSLISSSVKVSSSKNFSIRLSSFSAAASTRSLCSSIAFSFSSSGISSIIGIPPSGFHEYFFINSTSISALKSFPVLIGYCTCTHFEPYILFMFDIMLSKSHLSESSWLIKKITGFLSFSVYLKLFCVPTSGPYCPFIRMTA